MNSDLNLKSPRKEKPKPFKCTVDGCNAAFAKKRAFTNHTRKHTGERPFVCDEPECDKTYTNSSHLRRHKKVSHEKVDLKVECSYEGCKKLFSNNWNMKKHLGRVHNKERFPFNCSRCDRGFKKKRQLAQHMYEHTGEKAFNCDKCDAQYATIIELTKHKRNHKTYPCICGKVFHRWSAFIEHRRICVKLKPKCEICNKVFSTKQNLKQHMCIHVETRNRNVYLCVYKGCSRYYFYKKNLIHHIDRFHKKRVRKIPCIFLGCDKMLSRMACLKQHVLKVHKMGTQTAPKKPRKPRKDKGLPRLSTAGKLIGVNEPLSLQTDKEKTPDSSVNELLQGLISTFQDDICHN